MSSRMVRVTALVWSVAAIIQALSLVLRLRDGDGGWGLWISVVLLILWVSGAAGYWLLILRRPARPAPGPGAGTKGPARAGDPG